MWINVVKVTNTSRINIQLLGLFIRSSKEHLNYALGMNLSSSKPITIYNAPRFSMCLRPFSSSRKLQESISPLQIKKRSSRKKVSYETEELQQPGTYNVVAFSTAEEYNLEALKEGLSIQNLYEPKNMDHLPDVLHAVAKYPVGKDPREIFFFREGSVVFWNIADLESGNVINFLKPYEKDSYSEKLVQGEAELMKYHHKLDGKSNIIQTTGEICLAPKNNLLEKYTFSNTIASSVKLGIWEATLNKFIDSIEYITEDLKRGAKIRMSMDDVLTKQGELYGLRHLINLSSDLLDTPDYYWEHEELEHLYLQGYTYFNIGRRTKVINEKINHCIELIELLSTQLRDRHHVRLEWMIIVLIMMAVVFETLHYIDMYLSRRRHIQI